MFCKCPKCGSENVNCVIADFENREWHVSYNCCDCENDWKTNEKPLAAKIPARIYFMLDDAVGEYKDLSTGEEAKFDVNIMVGADKILFSRRRYYSEDEDDEENDEEEDEDFISQFWDSKGSLSCGGKTIDVSGVSQRFEHKYGSYTKKAKALIDFLQSASGTLEAKFELGKGRSKKTATVTIQHFDMVAELIKEMRFSWELRVSYLNEVQIKRFKKKLADHLERNDSDPPFKYQIIQTERTLAYYLNHNKNSVAIRRGASVDDDRIYNILMKDLALERGYSQKMIDERPFILIQILYTDITWDEWCIIAD